MTLLSILRCRFYAFILLLAACGDSNQDSRGQAKSDSDPRTKESPPSAQLRPEPPVPGKPRGDALDPRQPPNPRHALIASEWDAYEDAVITSDASTLPEKDRIMLRYLLDASKTVEELFMLQRHPDNLKWRDMLVAAGLNVEKKLFFRNQMPWCEDTRHPDCRVLDEAPTERSLGWMHWPEGFIDKDVKMLSSEINGIELLSPFTIVRRSASGGFQAVPYARNDTLGPKMKRLAALLRLAAANAPHPTLKRFLESRADAFESSKPFPYDKSDLDWIALEGDWEVTVGPYEVYENPFQIKALFEMIIAREDRPLTAELAKLKGRLQELENGLGALVGEAVYLPRRLDANVAIRAVEVWMASGDARKSRGATVAYHLPNRGEAIEKGLSKKVMLVNHALAFEPLAKARAELVLDPTLAAMVNFRDTITNTTFHELAHGFGAYSDMKIADKEGRRTTVREALRQYDSLMEELKADALGLWISLYLNARGELSEEGLMGRFVCHIIHTLGLLQYPLDGTYARSAAIQMGWLIENKAIAWHPDTHQLSIDPEKMRSAVTSLTQTVATLQLQGDLAAAKALYGKFVTDKNNSTSLKGPVDDIRSTILRHFEGAGIKSPSLRYAVKGLKP